MRRVRYALRAQGSNQKLNRCCAHSFLSQRRQATKRGQAAIGLMSRRAQLENNATSGALCCNLTLVAGPSVKPVATAQDSPSELSGFVPL